MKVPLLFKIFFKKRGLGASKVSQSDFQKIYENQYCQKTHQKKFIFLPFLVKSIPYQKNINFLQIPFLIFGPKKPLKVKNWIFQVFWGLYWHNFGQKKLFLRLQLTHKFKIGSVLTILAFYRSKKALEMPILDHILFVVKL